MPPAILVETARVVAVAKPSGIPVIPGRGSMSGTTLQQQVEAHLGAKVWVVHRLDAAASGAVLFAKDAEAHRDLNVAFEARTVAKSYLAAVTGRVVKEGVIRSAIKAFGSGRMGVHKHGQPSVTNYRILERFPAATLLEVSPETGRRHQIRVHLYSIGHPILGDPLYGESRPVGGFARMLLHAVALRVDTPSTGTITVRCDPDAEFQSLVRSLASRSSSDGSPVS